MTAQTVAVVVPMHDAALTIAETLQSVQAQSLGADQLEVVLVDDGSKDDSLALAVASLAPSGVRVVTVRHETPAGPSAARNAGWRTTASPWIQFLDADDLLAPSKCALQLGAAAQDSTAALVHSRWARLAPSGAGAWEQAGDDLDPGIGEDALVDLLRADNFIHVGSCLFRREALEAVGGFDPALRLVEDVDLLMSLALKGLRFLQVPSPGPLYWYRQRPGSLSRTDAGAFVDACVRNTRRAEAAWRDGDELTPARRRFLAELYGQAARHLAEHDPKAFDTIVRHIDELAPAFVPSNPPGLRRLSRLVGYPAAERLAVRYRRVRRLLHP